MISLFKYLGMMKKPGPACIVIAFIIVALAKIIYALKFPSPFIIGDEIDYFEKAKYIYSNLNIFSQAENLINVFPGYPLLIAVSNLFSSDTMTIYHLDLLINSFLTTSIIFPSYFILKKYCSSADVAVLGSITTATLPSVATYSFAMMSENLFIPLFAFSVWFMIKSHEEKGDFWLIPAILSVAYLLITKITGIAMVIGFLAAILYFYMSSPSRRRPSRHLLVIGLFMVSLIYIYHLYVYSDFLYMDSHGYLKSLFYVFSPWNLWSLRFLYINEIVFFLLVTYFVVFILFMLFLLSFFSPTKVGEETFANNRALKVAVVYFLISSAVLIAITITHMYWAPLSMYPGKTQLFQIFGRYVDPLVPMMFIFSFIKLDSIYMDPDGRRKSTKHLLILSAILLPLIFRYFPAEEPCYSADLLSVWYVCDLKSLFSLGITLTMTFFALIVLLLGSIFVPKMRAVFMLTVLCLASVGSLSTADREYGSSQIWYKDYGSLEGHANNPDELIILDERDKSEDPYLLFLTLFWTDAKVKIAPLEDLVGARSNDYDYVLTSRMIPGNYSTYLPKGYYLYSAPRFDYFAEEIPG
jgi:hypothetical protein